MRNGFFGGLCKRLTENFPMQTPLFLHVIPEQTLVASVRRGFHGFPEMTLSKEEKTNTGTAAPASQRDRST